MKNFLKIFFAVVMGVLLTACSKDSDFESADLVGSWYAGSVTYTFASGGSGRYSDTSQDVDQKLTWSLSGKTLTINIQSETTGHSPKRLVYKNYKIKTLNETTLTWEDATTGATSSFTRR